MICKYCYHKRIAPLFSTGYGCTYHSVEFSVREDDYCSKSHLYKCPECKTVFDVENSGYLDKCSCGYKFDWEEKVEGNK